MINTNWIDIKNETFYLVVSYEFHVVDVESQGVTIQISYLLVLVTPNFQSFMNSGQGLLFMSLSINTCFYFFSELNMVV